MRGQRRRVGEVRPSQVIHTFGIGSVVDLPNFSAVIMGLGEWDPPTPKDEIVEERLLALVRNHLGPSVDRLVTPPTPSGDTGRYNPFDPETKKGVPVAPFPRWVRCPLCDLIAPLDFGVFTLKENVWRPDRTAYVHENCQKARSRPPAVVPVRFVRACEHGHLDDFPWTEFVHGGPSKCPAVLRLREFGVSAEAADIVVQCDSCNASQPMAVAFSDKGKQLIGQCTGVHPHLRSTAPSCDGECKAMLSGASNLWFSVTLSALTIPSESGRLEQLMREHWPLLDPIVSTEILTAFRKAGHLEAFSEWSEQQLWAAIEAKRGGADEEGPRKESELKRAEWAVFSKPDPTLNGRNFQLEVESAPPGYENLIDKVVRVERLRVVKAQIGFTRIMSPGDYADVSEIPQVRRAPIARRPPEWVPASEVRGEGVFIQFREDALIQWLGNQAVEARQAEFFDAHVAFRRARRIEPPEASFPGARYVLLHSLSHALIRQFSIECGYGAASLQERIYAREPGDPDGGAMAGILLYTAAADSEGTLGGLVSLGQPRELARHLDQALESMRLCASDPLCSEHGPTGSGLHGGSCHACLFASETSCERGNKYLDRTLLVDTIGGSAVTPFFPPVVTLRT